MAGRVATHGHLPGGRPRAVAAGALPAAVGLEPDVHRAAPVAAAAGGAPGRGQAGGGRPVPQPHRPRGRRAPAPAARHRRRAGAGDDARGGRRRAGRRGLVPRARRRLRRAGRARWTTYPSRSAAELCGVPAEDDRAGGARVRLDRPRAAAPRAWAPSATSGAPAAYSHGGLPARADRRVAPRGRRLLVHPHRHRGRDLRGAAQARRPAARARCARSTCRRSATRSPTPASTRRWRRWCAGTPTPPRSRRSSARCWRACAATTSSRVVLEQFMTDTAAHADVVLPATTQLEHLDLVFSWGHHYFTLNEPAIEPRGRGAPNTEAFRRIAARMGLDDPCFSETDEEMLEALLEPGAGGRDAGRAALAGVREGRPGPGRDPARRGRFFTETAGSRSGAARFEPLGRGGRRRAGRALPAGDDHAEDPPVPQLDVRQP